MENPWKKMSSINPQRKPHREVNNLIWIALMRANLSAGEYKLIMAIIDRTWGFDKLETEISLTRFEWATRLTRRAVCKTIANLEMRRFIVVGRNGTKESTYMFNKHYDTWLTPAGELQFTSTRELEYTRLVNPSSLKSELQFTSTRELATPTTEPTTEIVIETFTETSIERERAPDKRKVYGEFKNVFLSEAEHEKLVERFGKKKTESLVEALSMAIKSKGYKYKDFYATILNWERRDSTPSGKGGTGAMGRRRPGSVPTAEDLDEQERRFFGSER